MAIDIKGLPALEVTINENLCRNSCKGPTSGPELLKESYISGGSNDESRVLPECFEGHATWRDKKDPMAWFSVKWRASRQLGISGRT